MEIDFNQTINDLDGKPIPNELHEAVTLKSISRTALLNMAPDEKLKPEDKVKRYDLAMKIYLGTKVDLTIEEIAMLKPIIGNSFGPLVVGRAYSMLEKK
ncbi:MAG: hypothetical protein WC307_06580 [Candidatus Nanoarchaeia archaeon]|jgi:hypothetical protein